MWTWCWAMAPGTAGGALADQISPAPWTGAGVGYVRLEASPDPVRVRAAYVTDDDINAMVAALTGDGDGW